MVAIRIDSLPFSSLLFLAAVAACPGSQAEELTGLPTQATRTPGVRGVIINHTTVELSVSLQYYRSRQRVMEVLPAGVASSIYEFDRGQRAFAAWNLETEEMVLLERVVVDTPFRLHLLQTPTGRIHTLLEHVDEHEVYH